MTTTAQPLPPAPPHFAPREHEILALIAEGMSDREIAANLGVSTRTVRTHLERLFRRHGLHSRTQALTLWLNTRLRIA